LDDAHAPAGDESDFLWEMLALKIRMQSSRKNAE